METFLTGELLDTYTRVLGEPNGHVFHWYELRRMLNALGSIVEQPCGAMKVWRNGNCLELCSTRNKQAASPEEVAQIRCFLQRSDAAPCPAEELERLIGRVSPPAP